MKKEKSKIKSFIHCKNCMSGQLAVGFFEDGIEIFCEDCELVVGRFNLPIPEELMICSDCKKTHNVRN